MKCSKSLLELRARGGSGGSRTGEHPFLFYKRRNKSATVLGLGSQVRIGLDQ
jgi:hypothetical protein